VPYDSLPIIVARPKSMGAATPKYLCPDISAASLFLTECFPAYVPKTVTSLNHLSKPELGAKSRTGAMMAVSSSVPLKDRDGRRTNRQGGYSRLG
jgi:hypothetical protein